MSQVCRRFDLHRRRFDFRRRPRRRRQSQPHESAASMLESLRATSQRAAQKGDQPVDGAPADDTRLERFDERRRVATRSCDRLIVVVAANDDCRACESCIMMTGVCFLLIKLSSLDCGA